MREMKFIRASLAALAASFFASGASAQIVWDFDNPIPVTIEQINDAGGFRVGDKVFSDFFVSTAAQTSETILVPGAASINVIGLQTGPMEFGIAFNSAWQVQVGEFLDTALVFKVTADTPNLIVGNTLEISGVVNTTERGSLSVSEIVYRDNPLVVNNPDILAIKQVFFVGPPNNFDLSDTQPFVDLNTNQPASEPYVWILKDILLTGGAVVPNGNNNGVVGLSFVKQTFEQVPEPSSAMLIGLGSLALLRRRRGA